MVSMRWAVIADTAAASAAAVSAAAAAAVSAAAALQQCFTAAAARSGQSAGPVPVRAAYAAGRPVVEYQR